MRQNTPNAPLISRFRRLHMWQASTRFDKIWQDSAMLCKIWHNLARFSKIDCLATFGGIRKDSTWFGKTLHYSGRSGNVWLDKIRQIFGNMWRDLTQLTGFEPIDRIWQHFPSFDHIWHNLAQFRKRQDSRKFDSIGRIWRDNAIYEIGRRDLARFGTTGPDLARFGHSRDFASGKIRRDNRI